MTEAPLAADDWLQLKGHPPKIKTKYAVVQWRESKFDCRSGVIFFVLLNEVKTSNWRNNLRLGLNWEISPGTWIISNLLCVRVCVCMPQTLGGQPLQAWACPNATKPVRNERWEQHRTKSQFETFNCQSPDNKSEPNCHKEAVIYDTTLLDGAFLL